MRKKLSWPEVADSKWDRPGQDDAGLQYDARYDAMQYSFIKKMTKRTSDKRNNKHE